jgi:hypothetical protein
MESFQGSVRHLLHQIVGWSRIARFRGWIWFRSRINPHPVGYVRLDGETGDATVVYCHPLHGTPLHSVGYRPLGFVSEMMLMVGVGVRYLIGSARVALDGPDRSRRWPTIYASVFTGRLYLHIPSRGWFTGEERTDPLFSLRPVRLWKWKPVDADAAALRRALRRRPSVN